MICYISDDPEATCIFETLPTVKPFERAKLNTTRDDFTRGSIPSSSLTPVAKIQDIASDFYVKAVAGLMASIQAMHKLQIEQFNERLETRKNQKYDMTQITAQFPRALEKQSIRHAKDTSRDNTPEVNEAEPRSQVVPRIPSPTEA